MIIVTVLNLPYCQQMPHIKEFNQNIIIEAYTMAIDRLFLTPYRNITRHTNLLWSCLLSIFTS